MLLAGCQVLEAADRLQLLPALRDACHEAFPVPVRGAVHHGWRLDAVVASELAHAVVMEDGGVGWNVERPVARSQLPHEVVARLHHELGSAHVLGALLVRVELGAASSLAQRHQRVAGVVVVGPLKVEEGVLDRVRARRARVHSDRHPSGRIDNQ